MAAKGKATAVLTERRPNLWFTESALSEALARLDGADPELQMTESEATAFLEQFVDADGVEARRDEFAEFLLDGEMYVAAELSRAEWHTKRAAKVRAGLERMREQATAIMRSRGLKTLAGAERVLRLKDSPGSVDVTDPDAVPDEFWRIRQDADLTRLAAMFVIVQRCLCAAYGVEIVEGDGLPDHILADEDYTAAAGLWTEAKDERRAVDKNAVKAAWKEIGETKHRVDENGEVFETPTIPGVRREVTTKLVVE